MCVTTQIKLETIYEFLFMYFLLERDFIMGFGHPSLTASNVRPEFWDILTWMLARVLDESFHKGQTPNIMDQVMMEGFPC